MSRILLHTCCGPCTIHPLDRLRDEGWGVYGYFYNPNIHPYEERRKRLEALRSLADQRDLPLMVRAEYELEHFLRAVAFREEQRCVICYSMRLEATAILAKKSGFDAFTSTLLYSKYQKHATIQSIGEAAAQKYDIPFFYQDFRTGWSVGQETAKRMNLYRQQYCGCIYSEKDRYDRPGRRSTPRNASPKHDPSGGVDV